MQNAGKLKLLLLTNPPTFEGTLNTGQEQRNKSLGYTFYVGYSFLASSEARITSCSDTGNDVHLLLLCHLS